MLRKAEFASVILVSGIGGFAWKFGDPTNPAIIVTSTAVAMILGIVLNFVLREKNEEAPALEEAAPAEEEAPAEEVKEEAPEETPAE